MNNYDTLVKTIQKIDFYLYDYMINHNLNIGVSKDFINTMINYTDIIIKELTNVNDDFYYDEIKDNVRRLFNNIYLFAEMITKEQPLTENVAKFLTMTNVIYNHFYKDLQINFIQPYYEINKNINFIDFKFKDNYLPLHMRIIDKKDLPILPTLYVNELVYNIFAHFYNSEVFHDNYKLMFNKQHENYAHQFNEFKNSNGDNLDIKNDIIDKKIYKNHKNNINYYIKCANNNYNLYHYIENVVSKINMLPSESLLLNLDKIKKFNYFNIDSLLFSLCITNVEYKLLDVLYDKYQNKINKMLIDENIFVFLSDHISGLKYNHDKNQIIKNYCHLLDISKVELNVKMQKNLSEFIVNSYYDTNIVYEDEVIHNLVMHCHPNLKNNKKINLENLFGTIVSSKEKNMMKYHLSNTSHKEELVQIYKKLLHNDRYYLTDKKIAEKYDMTESCKTSFLNMIYNVVNVFKKNNDSDKRKLLLLNNNANNNLFIHNQEDNIKKNLIEKIKLINNDKINDLFNKIIDNYHKINENKKYLFVLDSNEEIKLNNLMFQLNDIVDLSYISLSMPVNMEKDKDIIALDNSLSEINIFLENILKSILLEVQKERNKIVEELSIKKIKL